MNQPTSTTTQQSPSTKSTVIQVIKLAVQVREDMPPKMTDLLRAARELGMSLDDVLEMLS